MSFDQVGVMVQIDDGAFDAGLGQPVEHMVEHGAAGDFDEGLGQKIADRSHALAEPRRKHHGGLGNGTRWRREGFGDLRLRARGRGFDG